MASEFLAGSPHLITVGQVKEVREGDTLIFGIYKMQRTQQNIRDTGTMQVLIATREGGAKGYRLLCLQELALFQGLDRPEFANICLSAAKKKIDKGNFLFHQGEQSNTVYLIKAGKLKLLQVTAEGREVILDVIGPGEVLGETALFLEQEQIFSAVALEETGLCCFNRQQFETLIQRNPGFAVKIISYLGQKLYETRREAGEATGIPVKEKLLRLLIRLAGEDSSLPEKLRPTTGDSQGWAQLSHSVQALLGYNSKVWGHCYSG